ncbi:MAG TPA: hypothetical protein VK595_09545 [Vicinamibacterales bacterium]|nr:hypothetical protein [Vicinamibacterales bacterium]
MNRTTLLGVVLALGLFSSEASAQDQIFAFRGAHIDVPIETPCIAVSASMTVYDSNPWILFTCNTGQVILRRFLNPNDHAIAPVAVYTVENPNRPIPRDPRDTTIEACHVPGMVTGIYGGCVPLDHPNNPANR